MRILTAKSRSNTVLLLWHLDIKEELSLQLIPERQQEAMLVCDYLNAHTPCYIYLVASGTVKKVIEINPYLLGTMAGGAGADSIISLEDDHL